MSKLKKPLQPLSIIKHAARELKSQQEEHEKMKDSFRREWQKWGIQTKR